MRVPGFKVRYPRSDGEETGLRHWVEEYEKEAPQYSVCRFIEQAGKTGGLNDAIKFHDEATGAFMNRKLA